MRLADACVLVFTCRGTAGVERGILLGSEAAAVCSRAWGVTRVSPPSPPTPPLLMAPAPRLPAASPVPMPVESEDDDCRLVSSREWLCMRAPPGSGAVCCIDVTVREGCLWTLGGGARGATLGPDTAAGCSALLRGLFLSGVGWDRLGGMMFSVLLSAVLGLSGSASSASIHWLRAGAWLVRIPPLAAGGASAPAGLGIWSRWMLSPPLTPPPRTRWWPSSSSRRVPGLDMRRCRSGGICVEDVGWADSGALLMGHTAWRNTPPRIEYMVIIWCCFRPC